MPTAKMSNAIYDTQAAFDPTICFTVYGSWIEAIEEVETASDRDSLASQAAHFYDNEILGYQAQSYRGKSSKKEWWYVAASKNCPDTGRRGPSTISLKNLC